MDNQLSISARGRPGNEVTHAVGLASVVATYRMLGKSRGVGGGGGGGGGEGREVLARLLGTTSPGGLGQEVIAQVEPHEPHTATKVI